MFYRWFRLLYGLLSGLMISGIARLFKQKELSEDHELPSIAVIVAARNEAASLPNLLAALSAQQYPDSQVSFWIVDDNSEDRTYDMAKKLADQDERFHVLKSDPDSKILSPKKRALDAAIRQANAEWIVTTDADCVPGPAWLMALSKYMMENTGIIVGYSPLSGGTNPLEFLAMGESWSAAALAASGIGAGYPFNAVGRNFSFRRNIYLDLDGYGRGEIMASGDDDLFMQRVVAKTNWKVAFARDPRSHVISQVQKGGNVLKAKVRHMSVGTHYAPGWVVLGAIGSLLFMGLGLLTPLAWLNMVDKTKVNSIWKWKWFNDILMALAALSIINDKKRALLSLATMTAAPFGFWYIWPKALFGTVHWKGRKFKRGRADI